MPGLLQVPAGILSCDSHKDLKSLGENNRVRSDQAICAEEFQGFHLGDIRYGSHGRSRSQSRQWFCLSPTKNDFRAPLLLLSIEEGPRSLCVHFLSHNHLDPRPIRLSKNPVSKPSLVSNSSKPLQHSQFQLLLNRPTAFPL